MADKVNAPPSNLMTRLIPGTHMVEGVVCSFKIATTLAQDRVAPWPLLASLLYRPLALGGDRSTSPLLRLLNMGIKDTHWVRYF